MKNKGGNEFVMDGKKEKNKTFSQSGEKTVKHKGVRGGIRRFMRNNSFYKVVAVVAAALVWLYVINALNPQREKIVRGVDVYFTNEAALNAENLVIVGDKANLLKDVDLTVSVQASDLSKVSNNNVEAYVDLQGIRKAGKYSMLIKGKTAWGNVAKVTPSTVEVEVDLQATRTVPVQVQYSGELPEGYWHGEAEVTLQSIELKGPKTYIEKVQKAICEVTLDDRTEGFNNALSVVLVDANNVVMDSSTFDGDLSVTVAVPILPTKNVPIDLNCVYGLDQVAAGYEVLEVTILPTSVDIAASQAVLDGIEKLNIEAISVEGESSSVLKTVPIIKPNNEIIFTGESSVQIYVQIAEKQGNAQFVDIPIVVKNLGRGLEWMLARETGAVTLTGPLSQINKLKRGNVSLYVDVTDLAAGVHSVPVQIELPSGAEDVSGNLVPATVTITISEK